MNINETTHAEGCRETEDEAYVIRDRKFFQENPHRRIYARNHMLGEFTPSPENKPVMDSGYGVFNTIASMADVSAQAEIMEQKTRLGGYHRETIVLNVFDGFRMRFDVIAENGTTIIFFDESALMEIAKRNPAWTKVEKMFSSEKGS